MPPKAANAANAVAETQNAVAANAAANANNIVLFF